MNNNSKLIFLFIIFFAISFLIIYLINNFFQEKKKIKDKILKLVSLNNNMNPMIEQSFAFHREKKSVFERKLYQILKNKPSFEEKFRLKIYRAGLEKQINYIFLGMAAIFPFIIFFFIKSNIISHLMIIPVILSIYSMVFYFILNYFDQRFKHKFLKHLSNAIDIISRGIRAGSSIEKTFLIVSKETPDPLAQEFKKIIQQIEFGVSFEEAMRQAAKRIDLVDFHFLSSALIIQRTAGGTLGEILENIILSLTRSSEIRLKIKAVTAEGKVTAYVLGALPILLWLVMMKLNPEYIRFFIDTYEGRKLFLIAVGFLGAGMGSIKYMMKIRS